MYVHLSIYIYICALNYVLIVIRERVAYTWCVHVCELYSHVCVCEREFARVFVVTQFSAMTASVSDIFGLALRVHGCVRHIRYGVHVLLHVRLHVLVFTSGIWTSGIWVSGIWTSDIWLKDLRNEGTSFSSVKPTSPTPQANAVSSPGQ